MEPRLPGSGITAARAREMAATIYPLVAELETAAASLPAGRYYGARPIEELAPATDSLRTGFLKLRALASMLEDLDGR